ncbi:putative SET domain-containing protein [Helianthus debilis subsp. tardiflorus]
MFPLSPVSYSQEVCFNFFRFLLFHIVNRLFKRTHVYLSQLAIQLDYGPKGFDYDAAIILPDLSHALDVILICLNLCGCTCYICLKFTHIKGIKSCCCSVKILLMIKPLTFARSRQRLKELMGYTLELKSSQIRHEQASWGLFIDGEAYGDLVIALYAGIIYSPAYYHYIFGYPRVNTQNPYLITHYDGTVINGQPWGTAGETTKPCRG